MRNPQEPELACHQTGHNSGVIHAGMYYAPGSLKAQLCVKGNAKMYAYCDARNIPYDRCGKVIVAAEEEEVPRLEEIFRRGKENKVAGLSWLNAAQLKEVALPLRTYYRP